MADSTSGIQPPKIVIIAGPNGAGKSTLAPVLLRDTFGVMEFVNADTIAQGLSAFQPEGVAVEAGRVMLRRMRELAARRATFAFESTLAGRSYAAWLDRLRDEGYEFHLCFLWLRSPEIAVERVGERVHRGGHSVPEDLILRRYRGGLRNFFRLYKPRADTWGLYDNSESGGPVMVASGTSGAPPTVCEPERWRSVLESAT